MRSFGLYLFFAVMLVLQTSFLAALRPLGIVPDVTLIIVIIAGLSSTVSRAVTLAVVGGVVLDLASGADFGLRTGLFVIAALVTGVVRRAGLTLIGPLVAVALVAVATLAQSLIIVADLAGSVSVWPWGFITRTILVELMVNLALTVLMHPAVVWLSPKDAALPVIE